MYGDHLLEEAQGGNHDARVTIGQGTREDLGVIGIEAEDARRRLAIKVHHAPNGLFAQEFVGMRQGTLDNAKDRFDKVCRQQLAQRRHGRGGIQNIGPRDVLINGGA